MAVKFKIKDGCVGCGLCFTQYADYFQETSEGLAEVNEGKILPDNTVATKIADSCPNHLIVVENTGESMKQSARKALEKLKNYPGCPMPNMSEIRFKREEYSVDIPYAQGENRYDYSSDSAAERAALSEFKRCMYSQIDSIILKIITQYRVNYIKPYYSKEISDGSVYAKTNAEVSKMLKEIKNIVGRGLSADFEQVNVFPDDDYTWKMLNKGQLISDEKIDRVKSEFDYTADRYDCYWDTDSMERYAGTNWRGDTKYKDMYCYRNMREAFKELGRDIIDACYYARDGIEESAFDCIKWLIEQYNKKLKEVLKAKITQAEQVIDKMNY